MKTLNILVLLLVSLQSSASLLEQLSAFNPYWCAYQEQLADRPQAVLPNDQAYVQAHLEEVLEVLKTGSIEHLSCEQQETRLELLSVLADYADQGCFPQNYYRNERVPVFIDEHNTHCAVGYLMKHTGDIVLAQRIAEANNYAWVREISDRGLLAWQQATGFSLDELKLIQGAYDSYIFEAFLLPNRYEVPQKPEQVTRYFEGKESDKIWCYGEGENGDLHGKWIQNYSSTMPWIVGYFEHGKRSGRWKEYYKGTDKLCRTEHWRNDKLNGVRTRYDRDGKVIETIHFRNGEAVTKINIDHIKALRYVRRPIDSIMVQTEVFTLEGAMIAAGKERIHNPGGLSWFQNIELTALNTFAISARDGAPQPELGFISTDPFANQFNQLPGSHILVKYKKEGDWSYYKDYLNCEQGVDVSLSPRGWFEFGYAHFGSLLYEHLALYNKLQLSAGYDSLKVKFENDHMVDMFGYRSKGFDHLQFSYYETLPQLIQYQHRIRAAYKEQRPIRCITRFNEEGALIGTRSHFDRNRVLVREDLFLIPFKEEEDEVFGSKG